MRKIVFISLLLTLALNSLRAQTERRLNEITVEAQAERNAIEEQKKSIPAKIVISAKDLNNYGNHTVGDILKRLPRIFVQGPPSFNRNIMMGGLDKQFQSILINGNRPGGGEDYRDFKLDRIPADMVEEIEIIYNPPAEWGSDAAMGVVNIRLKDVPNKQVIRANVAFDHTSTRNTINPNMSVLYGDNFGKLSVLGSYSYNRFKRTNVTSLTENGISGKETEDLDVDIHGLTGTINYRFNDQSNLKLQSFYSNYKEDLDFLADIKRRSDGTLNFTADTAVDNKQRLLHTHNLAFEKTGENWNWTNSINFSQHKDNKDRWRMTAKTAGLTESLEDEDQENSEAVFKSDYSLRHNKHLVKAGIRASGLWRDYSRWVYTKLAGRKYWDEITDGSYVLDEYRAGMFVSDAITWNKFVLAPSVRLDYDMRSYRTSEEEGDFQYFSFNPSVHAKYSFQKQWFVKADVARQISRPPFNNQVPVDKIKHKKSTIERGNSELLPSSAVNMSAGLEKYFNDNSYFTFRGFYSIMRDVIENKNVGIDNEYGYQIIQAVNVDSGLVWGLDFDARIQVLKHRYNELALTGNVSWLGSRVRDASTGDMRRLNEQPQWMGNASIDYLNTALKLQLSVGANYVGKRFIAGGSDEGTLVAPLEYQPYFQCDARLKYFFKPWGSVFINAVNLFNEKMITKQAEVTESEVVGSNIGLGLSFML